MATKPKENTPATGGGASAAPDSAALAAENERLKKQLAEAEAGKAEAEERLAADTFSPDDRKLVDAKIAAGLTPSQAEEVVKAQKKHDANLAAA